MNRILLCFAGIWGACGGGEDGGPYVRPEPLAIDVTIEFPSGDRVVRTHAVEDSFGDAPPPPDALLDDSYTPRAGECSTATHDRFWVRAQDGRVYRTWHPPDTIDVETGEPCAFGHEHGDDPRESPLYEWAGGVPFGMVNHIAQAWDHHRSEDHVGHKVVVQNEYEAAVGNGPGDAGPQTFGYAGFTCYWLSKVHQGTHSGDALRHNMHEYQNNVMCDDGAARNADAGRGEYVGASHHTQGSVKALAFWGQPGSFKACDERAQTPTGTTDDGLVPPANSDTNREIKCARANGGAGNWTFDGWFYKQRPNFADMPSFPGAPAHVNYSPDDAGNDELWKPWLAVNTKDGKNLYTSSAYYIVLDPIRLYNDGSFVAKRDVDGDGTLDDWIPTLEVCLKAAEENADQAACSNLPDFPASVAKNDWWTLPQSPFRGTMRAIHPKGIGQYNETGREFFCTDFMGTESENEPSLDEVGLPVCPDGQLLQKIASTRNLWIELGAAWGPGQLRGAIQASMVNARSPTKEAGYRHEWVRDFSHAGVHAPN